MKTLIIIAVSGSLVQTVYGHSKVRVIVADFDSYKAGDEKLCQEMQPEPLTNADDLIRHDPLVEKALTQPK